MAFSGLPVGRWLAVVKLFLEYPVSGSKSEAAVMDE